MMYEFLKLEKATNGEWMLQFSEDNSAPDFVWVDERMARIIQSAQRAAKNELRRTIKKALEVERLDGRNPV